MQLLRFFLAAVSVAALASCKTNDDDLPDPQLIDSVLTATTADSVVMLNDTMEVFGPVNIYRCDVDSDGINDFAIHAQRTYNQTSQTANFRIVRLNPGTIVHAQLGTQNVCAVPDTVGGYAGTWLLNCNGAGTQHHSYNFAAAIRLDTGDLTPSLPVANSGADTVVLAYSYANQGAPYPNYVFSNYGYGAFRSSDGYFVVSVNGQRFAYRIRIQIPYVLVEERRKF